MSTFRVDLRRALSYRSVWWFEGRETSTRGKVFEFDRRSPEQEEEAQEAANHDTQGSVGAQRHSSRPSAREGRTPGEFERDEQGAKAAKSHH